MSLEHSPARQGKKVGTRSLRASELGIERHSFTLREFALRHGLSDSAVFKLFREGRGPSVMLIGSVGKRVSLEAEKLNTRCNKYSEVYNVGARASADHVAS